MTMTYFLLDHDELEAARRRIERFFGLQDGELSPDMDRVQPAPQEIRPQDTTEEIELIQIVPEEREQVIYDIWKILQTASAFKK